MTDQTSTQVLANGAIRYAVYDAAGTLLRYEYLLPADSPSVVGTPINKNTMLTDATAAAIGGLPADPTVNNALMGLQNNIREVDYNTNSWRFFVCNMFDYDVIKAMGGAK